MNFVGKQLKGQGLLALSVNLLYLAVLIHQSHGQMSSDPRLCGGYMREINGYIDFVFNENTAPPGSVMTNKFCMWTISPTVPTERFSYNMTIRNVNLTCAGDADSITINYFNQSSDQSNLGFPNPGDSRNPLCMGPTETWERKNTNGTTMVVILQVKEVVYGKGFYLEWEEGYDSRISEMRVRNTYYSFGKPSVAPNPYFAAGFRQNEISTFGFIKANVTSAYTMDLQFREIRMCEGQGDWQVCFDNTVTVFNVGDNGQLIRQIVYRENITMTPTITSKNGFFIIVKVEDKFGGGGRFNLVYETVRG